MPESQGISRRDLLKRGAALGGAVVWATPVVQTLGMGRAFAANGTPVGDKDISYVGITVQDCVGGDPADFFVKWDDGAWETSPGHLPSCMEKDELPQGISVNNTGITVTPTADPACVKVMVPTTYEECDVKVWVKAGQTCNELVGGTDFDFGVEFTACSLV